jgi:hypothetical protein
MWKRVRGRNNSHLFHEGLEWLSFGLFIGCGETHCQKNNNYQKKDGAYAQDLIHRQK